MRAVSGPCWPFKIAGAAAIAATNFRLVSSMVKTLTAILQIFPARCKVRESTREDPTMKRYGALVLLLPLMLLAADVPAFRDMFNGKDLTGWVNVNTAA